MAIERDSGIILNLLFTVSSDYRLKPIDKANVYDLQVVQKQLLNGEHFTISASGVMFIPKDGRNPEFTPIGELVYNIFHQQRVNHQFIHKFLIM